MTNDDFNKEFDDIEKEVRSLVGKGSYLQEYSSRLKGFKARRMMRVLKDIEKQSGDANFRKFLFSYQSYIENLEKAFPRDDGTENNFNGAGAHSKVSFINHLRIIHNTNSLVSKDSKTIQINEDGVDYFESMETQLILSFVAENIYDLLRDKRGKRRSFVPLGAVLLVIFGILYGFGFPIAMFTGCVFLVILFVYFLFMLFITSGEIDIYVDTDFRFVYYTAVETKIQLGTVCPDTIVGNVDFGLENFDLLVPGNLLTNLEPVLTAIEPIAKKLYNKGLLFQLPSSVNPKSPMDVEKYIDSVKFSLSKV